MEIKNSYKIYNASAGSGKTYTLVKDYLILLLQSNQPDAYRNILAITFTNKAVAEMKTRVISALHSLSLEDVPGDLKNLMADLVLETGYPEEKVKEKSRMVLKSILHNYASFDISTIDRFTHKVIRTFAKDLGLPVNFEVEMNTLQILEEAVDRLINRAGDDNQLTKILVNFTLSKTDDDKSWDIAKDLFNFSKILLHENHIPYVSHLKNKSLQDYKDFSEKIKTAIAASEEGIAKISEDFFRIVESEALKKSSFNRGYVYEYFSKLDQKNYKVTFGLKWQETLEEDNLYSAKVPQIEKEALDRNQQEIALLFKTSKAAVLRREFLKELNANLIPLSLLGEIANEMQEIKKERALILISDFNPTIAAEVKDQLSSVYLRKTGRTLSQLFY
ncbi:UvrD-helicase domain-containing protein [Antarcticibacterium sp. 1MA-6-2]|uniref:UvrD-helicase domain-containing protein n=1 Tax=Antarcticibacterium sp. 1MA-6-2 TaxID=2908210 RepID=UPI001F3C3964|nr:UvrD-helicase domain-containing protein [Antarcticibacterium sp. 1MA-6-2]UJH90036.1 UvrD-helicase domain-containing protein [Antarcticibacterium sp. 1MA-6-2]